MESVILSFNYWALRMKNEENHMNNHFCLLTPQGSYGVKKFYGLELEKYLKKHPEKVGQKEQILFSIDLEGKDKPGKKIVYLWSSPATLGNSLKELRETDLILTRDENTKLYLEKKMHLTVHMLPLFGIPAVRKKKYQDRTIPVFFPGSYLDTDSTIKNIKEAYPSAMYEIAMGCIKWMDREKKYDLEEGIRHYLEQEGIDYSEDMIYSYIEEYGFGIEDYFRRKLRNQLIETLLKDQIPIHVCGVNWNVFYQKLPVTTQKYLHVHEQNLSPRSISNIMADSKVVLDLASNIYEGMHERVTMAMMNGAICVTNQNNYIKEELEDQNAVEFFSWDHLKNLSRRIKKILQNQENSAKRSELASQIANRKYTAERFWEQICRWDKGELNE